MYIDARTAAAPRWGAGVPLSTADAIANETPELASVSVSRAGIDRVGIRDANLPVANAPVSANFFSMLGVQPASGRVFGDADARNPVAVVSDRFWHQHFASDSLPGTSATLTIDQTIYTVIGVAPASFNFPEGVDIWYPVASNPVWARNDCCFWMIGRMRSTGLASRLNLRLASLATSMHSSGSTVLALQGRPMRALLGKNPIDAVFGLGAAVVGSIALLTVLNTALLFFTQALARVPEFAVRSALGATRVRLCATLGVQIASVCALGALIAFGLASLATIYVVHVAGNQLPPWLPLRINHVLVLSIATLWAVATAVSASIPMVRLFIRDRDLLAATGRGGFGGKQDERVSERLIGAEIAIAVSFVCASAVFAFNLARRLELSDAVRAEGLYVVPAKPPFGLAKSIALSGLPADATTSYEQSIILLGRASVHSEGSSSVFTFHSLRNAARLRSVGPNYLSVTGIRVLSGHPLTGMDRGDEPSALISTTAAHLFFGSRNPAGRLLTIDSLDDKTPRLSLRISGVVGDLRDGAWAMASAPPVIVTNWRPARPYQLRFYLRTVRPSGLRSAVSAISALIPNWTLGNTESLTAARHEEVHGLWVPVMVFGPIGVLTLLLAIIGVIGLIRFTTARRLRELAIRSALGSTNSGLACFVGRRLLVLALFAGAIGAGGALLFVAIGSGSLQNAVAMGLARPLIASLAVVALCVVLGAMTALQPLWQLNPSQLLNDSGGGRRR